MPPHLRLLDEDATDGERFDVVDEFLIGRELPEPGARGFVLAHPEASRRHAIVRRLASGELELEDLGSKNGTLVNGALVRGRRELVVGDRVTIGMTIFTVRQDVEETRLSDPRVGLAETAIRPSEAPAPELAPNPAPRTEPRPAFAPHMPSAHAGAIASRTQTPTIVTILAIVATAAVLVIYFAMR